MSELSKLQRMGIITPQTKYLESKPKSDCFLNFRDKHEKPEVLYKGEMKFDETGRIVTPPMVPEKPFKGHGVKMTRKLHKQMKEYRANCEMYEDAKAKYDGMLTTEDFPPTERPEIETTDDNPVFDYWSRGIVANVRVLSRPIKEHKAHLMTWEESINFNPDKPKVEPQTTLDGIVRFAKPLRTVDAQIIESFGIKPNHLLEREWLLHIINGERLSITGEKLLKERKEMMRGL